MEHFIRHYENALDSQICDEIVALFEKDETKRPGINLSGHVATNKITTDLYIKNIGEWAVYETAVQKCIGRYLNEYVTEFEKFFRAVKGMGDSGYQIMKYDAYVGRFNPHTDVNGLKSCQRVLGCVLYLNDVIEGGETHFISQDISIKPVKGRLAIFPSNFTHLHQGKVATSDKYVISTFVTYTQ